MANEHHDELGRFCSAKQEKKAQQRMLAQVDGLLVAGKLDEAMALRNRYGQIWTEKTPQVFTTTDEAETADFDTIGFGSLIDRARGFFGRGRQASAASTQEAEASIFDTAPPIPEGRFVLEGENGSQNEFQDYGTEFKNIRGFFRITGDPEQDAEAYERASKIDQAWGTQQELQEVEAAVLFDGEGAFATADEQKYFYNPELKASIPDLSGWQPENATQGFIVKQMIDAALNQKTAALQNADLQVDPALIALGLDPDGERDIKVVKGQDANEDSGLISNYDEGWLTGFYTAVTKASQQHFTPGDEAGQKAQLGAFLAEQRAYWQTQVDLVDNDFNNGALDGFAEDNWARELR